MLDMGASSTRGSTRVARQVKPHAQSLPDVVDVYAGHDGVRAGPAPAGGLRQHPHQPAQDRALLIAGEEVR